MHREGAIAERTACDWFAKFRNGNFDLKDAPQSSRPVELDEEQLSQLLCKNSHLTTRELAEKIKCSHTAIEKYFLSMGKVQMCGAWFPYVLVKKKSTSHNLRWVVCSIPHN